MTWLDTARAAIARIDAAQPAGVTVEQRLAAIDAGYPFGARRCFAYKAWLKARREWRGRNGAPLPRRLETPLERAIRSARNPLPGNVRAPPPSLPGTPPPPLPRKA